MILMLGAVSVGAVYYFLNYSFIVETSIAGLLMGATIASYTSALKNENASHESELAEWYAQYEHWENSWYCYKCGEISNPYFVGPWNNITS